MPKSHQDRAQTRVLAGKKMMSKLGAGTTEFMHTLEGLWRQKWCVVRVPDFSREAFAKTAPPEEPAGVARRELAHLRPPFLEYYEARQRNFLRSTKAFRPLWECFLLQDRIVARELKQLEETAEIHKLFPLIPFQNAHSKMRLALELGFSGCLSEAHLILRDAIESVAHAHRIFSDPKRLKTWLEQNDGTPAESSFESELWCETEERLFDGLEDLHRLWRQFSSHTNTHSVLSQFEIEETPSHLEGQLIYNGIELQLVVGALFDLLLVFQHFDEVLYKDCEDLLKTDLELGPLRSKFQKDVETIRTGMLSSLQVRHATG